MAIQLTRSKCSLLLNWMLRTHRFWFDQFECFLIRSLNFSSRSPFIRVTEMLFIIELIWSTMCWLLFIFGAWIVQFSCTAFNGNQSTMRSFQFENKHSVTRSQIKSRKKTLNRIVHLKFIRTVDLIQTDAAPHLMRGSHAKGQNILFLSQSPNLPIVIWYIFRRLHLLMTRFRSHQ